MAMINTALMLVPVASLHHQVAITDARLDIGVCYGMIGDNLPSSAAVVQLYWSHNISKLQHSDLNPAVLIAWRGTRIEVTVVTLNQDLQSIASQHYRG